MKCCWIAFYPQLELLSKLESVVLNPAAAALSTKLQYSKSFVVISTVFTAPAPGVDSRVVFQAEAEGVQTGVEAREREGVGTVRIQGFHTPHLPI